MGALCEFCKGDHSSECQNNCPAWMSSVPFCWPKYAGAMFTDIFLMNANSGIVKKVFDSSFTQDLIGCNFYEIVNGNFFEIKKKIRSVNKRKNVVRISLGLKTEEHERLFTFQVLYSNPSDVVMLGFETESIEGLKESIEENVHKKTKLESELRKQREHQLLQIYYKTKAFDLFRWSSEEISKNMQQLAIDFEILGDFVEGETGAFNVLRRIQNEIDSTMKRLHERTQIYDLYSRTETFPISVNDLIERHLKLFCRKLPDHSEFMTDLQSSGLVDGAHPILIVSVIDDVVKNAVDAISDMEYGEIVIRTSDSDDGKWVYVFIENNGPVIPEELRGKLFDAFFTTKGRIGMTLHMLRNYVNAAGGDFQYVPLGAEWGSRFVVKLKRAREKKCQVIDLAVGTMKNEKVLVINRDERLLEAECRFLQRYGYNAIGANFIPDALKNLVENGPFDLVIIGANAFRSSDHIIFDLIYEKFPDLPIFVIAPINVIIELTRYDSEKKQIREFIERPYKLPLLLSKMKKLFS